MNIFNRFIDNIKDTYLTVLNNKKTLINSSIMILIIRIIQVICAITIVLFFVNFFISDINKSSSLNSFEISDIFKYILLIIFSILFFLALQTITIIIESAAAIHIVDEFELSLKNIKDYIFTNFFKIYGGIIVIAILSSIVIGIGYLLLLVAIIPIAVLTFGIGFIFINTYVYSSFTYWNLLSIRDKTSVFKALEKNITLGFNNIFIIVLFNLMLVSFTSILSSIIGFLAIPIIFVIGLIIKIILNIFVLKLIEE